jgi:DDB1- and CUL4-associated factor 13
VRAPNAHKGRVSGLCWADETRVLSCGVDNNVKMWDMRPSVDDMDGQGAGPSEVRSSPPSHLRSSLMCIWP